jgi:hypothetical protein
MLSVDMLSDILLSDILLSVGVLIDIKPSLIILKVV